MHSMKLFWTPASPFVRKVIVAAIELGLRDQIEIYPTYWPHEWGSRTIEFDREFVAANPVGRIPSLVTKDGIAISESNWICDYLESLSTTTKLIPPSGPARWRCIRLLSIADGALEAMIARRAEMLRTVSERSMNFVGKQRDRISRCLDNIEREVDTLEGELTLAQITVGIACGYMDFRYPEDNWSAGRPRLSAWTLTFARRPSMTQTVPVETPQRRTSLVDES